MIKLKRNNYSQGFKPKKGLRIACEYKETLEEVFKEHSKMEHADSTSRPHYEDTKPNKKKNNNNNNK